MSKKSGDWRWPSLVSSKVVIAVASTRPSMAGVSPPVIVPSNPGTRPLIVMRPIFFTSNSSVDHTGSIDQLPVGMRLVAVVSATMVIHDPPCVRYY